MTTNRDLERALRDLETVRIALSLLALIIGPLTLLGLVWALW